MASFRSALAHMDAHQWRPARAALDSAIARSPQWPEAYYDRALTSIALQQPAAAIGDLESYLRLRPEADDRTAVVATIGALRRQQLSPSGALVRGIVIPGLGQFYTRRPIPGVLVLGAVAGAIVFAEQSQRTTEDRSYTDPFGNVVHYSVQVDKRPHEVAGLAAAGAVALGAAIESFFYARGVRASDRPPAPAPPRRAALRIAPVIAPSANGALRLGVSLGSSAP
jgi:cytochrome c-type biogenesis protein CcmH/NrfG